MEEVKIRQFLSGSGSGDGDGSGSGSGDGDGSGSGFGYGSGDGDGDGSGDGSGYGYGSGDGSGYGYGSGDGSGYGYGSGDGDGDGSGDGFGYGSGDGFGSGDGSGYGSGDGDGDGDGSGYGSGSGDGDGSGSGSGDGDGYGSGDGDGYGDGFGDGSGDGFGIKLEFHSGSPVHYIDSLPCVIRSIKGQVAKVDVIDTNSFLSTSMFVAKHGGLFAHGKTLKEAIESVQEKWAETRSLEERIEEFRSLFKDNILYDSSLFYKWHSILTGSCQSGKDFWIQQHGIDLKKEMTVMQFCMLTRKAYGGSAIEQLMKYYK